MTDNKKTYVIFFFMLAAAFLLRIWHLDLRPLHHDEGTFWYFFLAKLYNGETLKHFNDFHGFSYVYLNTIPLFFLDDTVFAIRIANGIAGSLTVGLLFFLRSYLGQIGFLLTVSFLALSPTMVFYSRQFNIFTYLVLFLLIAFIFLVYYADKKKPIYIYGFAATLGILAATHELSILFLPPIFLFLVIDFFEKKSKKMLFNDLVTPLVFSRTGRITIVVSLLIFLSVFIAIMSSFFTNFSNLKSYVIEGSFQVGKIYNTGHNKGIFFYILTMFPFEWFAFIGTALGVLFFNKNKVFQFLILWVMTSLVTLSIIPYKIPWIFMLVLLPMYLLAGLTFNELFLRAKNRFGFKNTLITGLLASLMMYGVITVRFSFIVPQGKNHENPLNYVGPMKEFQKLLIDLDTEINELAARRILVATTSQWPLPYYLRHNQTRYIDKNIESLDTYHNKYDLYIISPLTHYDKNKFVVLGEYEIRENDRVILLH